MVRILGPPRRETVSRRTGRRAFQQGGAVIITAPFSGDEIDGCVTARTARRDSLSLTNLSSASAAVRAGDSRFTTGERTIYERSELLPQRLFHFQSRQAPA